MKAVADGVNKLRRPDNATLVITHYQRLLDYIVPDFVHVLVDGRIVKSGGKELALTLEARGYDWLLEETAARRAMTTALDQTPPPAAASRALRCASIPARPEPG